MTKSDEQIEPSRRPAARRPSTARTVAVSVEVGPDGDEGDADASQTPKRIHARRVETNGHDSVPPPKPRPVAARAGRNSSAPPPPLSTRSSPPPSAARSNPPPSALRSNSPPSAARSNPPPSAAKQLQPAPIPDARDLDSMTTLHSDAAAPESAALLAASAPPKRSTALRVHAELVDEFGLDAHYEAKMRPFFEAMCRNYLHLQVSGAQHIPERGRALLVSNHSRSLAWDGILLRTVLRLNHPNQREARWLVEDDQFHAPFLGTFISRVGAVRACQENAER
ncbi:MAG TPA: 1-acyl-sn-glycerol-3-phosphate acyltransferase, partial [Polyangiales bacterium]|nr:1-acyl-sn-glycerol-3-phosphate acyltransferase [Polyangiales bacterium]